jgi:predicted nucleic acid-binding protein
MPIAYLLDTSVYSQPLKISPLPAVKTRWANLGDDSLAISAICEAEVLYGLELKQSTKLFELYESLLRNRLQNLPVDSTVAREFAEIKSRARRDGHSCSDFDFLIAATAKAHGLTVATLNYRHFTGISGLAVEDWSSAAPKSC